MSFWDSVGSAFDWVSKNADTIGKVVDTGRKAYNLFDINSARQGTRSDILDYIKQQEANDNAYNQQMWAYRNAQAGAASANAAARRKAAQKAYKQQSKMLKALIEQYQPYATAAKELTPKMSENYKQFLDTTSLLNQYLTPKVMQNLNSAPAPSWGIDVPRSAYAVPMVQSEAVSFPTPEEALQRRK